MGQLWVYPKPNDPFPHGMSEDDCDSYDIVQSSATHPLRDKSGYSSKGWLYLECGEGQNWFTMAKDYWCTRASWVTMYALNLTQHMNPVLQSQKWQSGARSLVLETQCP